MVLHKTAKSFLTYWWLPPLVFALFCIATLLHLLPISAFTAYALVILFFASLASLMGEIFQKQWLSCSVLMLLIIICTYSASVILGLLDKRPDGFADHLTIPETIPYAHVIGIPHQVNPIPTACDAEKLLLYFGPRAGEYLATLCISTEEDGTLFLRAYEVTTSTPLSAFNLRKNTMVPIKANDPILRKTALFFIKEGDPGTYYAARFEVWFAPQSGTQERLLLEKVFKIEGGV